MGKKYERVNEKEPKISERNSSYSHRFVLTFNKSIILYTHLFISLAFSTHYNKLFYTIHYSRVKYDSS